MSMSLFGSLFSLSSLSFFKDSFTPISSSEVHFRFLWLYVFSLSEAIRSLRGDRQVRKERIGKQKEEKEEAKGEIYNWKSERERGREEERAR